MTRTHSRPQQLRIQCQLACIALLCFMSAAARAADAKKDVDPFQLCVAEQVIYDDNLYRLNQDINAQQRLGANGSRDDYVWRTSACANGDWQFSRQEVVLKAEIADNRYTNNKTLNHTSGSGTLSWDWSTANDWSGKLGASGSRALGTFMSDRPTEKDLVDSYQYFGELRHLFGAYLSAFASGQRTAATHSAPSRELDDYGNNAGTFGLVYATRADTSLGVDYEYNRSKFAALSVVNGVSYDMDYNESVTSVRGSYDLGTRTVVTASLGYLQRRYPQSAAFDYSGDVWRASLQWPPSPKTQLLFSAWRELTAYVDAEADHFISKGVSLKPTWAPREKLKFSGLVWWEKQDYLSSSLAALVEGQREDKVFTAGLDAIYAPVTFFELDLGYRHEKHDSNQPLLGYVDNVATATLRGKF
jgi:hypothetical protein